MSAPGHYVEATVTDRRGVGPALLSTVSAVYERTLRRCRACIRDRSYVVTLHAADEMNADGYSILDLEFGILTGTMIEAQRDRETSERKYRIGGTTGRGQDIELVVKFGVTGRMIVITVYEP